jgi:DNA-directed RNA polymerase subunit beta'
MKNYIEVKLASPRKLLSWTERSLINKKLIGEVKNAETIIDYKNYKPIFEGLFCERIFGPTKDFECSCKKYKKTKKTKEIKFCKNCNVQITDSKIRNYRIGYINLKVNIIHPWYFKKNPNYLSIILNKSRIEINNIIYNKFYILLKRKKITGGEAIKILLEKINLQQICDYT